MRMGDWADAESYLLEAYEKDAKNPDTLANLVTVSLHLGKNATRHSRRAFCLQCHCSCVALYADTCVLAVSSAL